MRRSKAERDSSFATFMDQAGPALLRTAWFLTGDADHAQELTQAAFVPRGRDRPHRRGAGGRVIGTGCDVTRGDVAIPVIWGC